MDVIQKLDWKQIVIAVIALWAFGKVFAPIQVFALSHPFIGVLILIGLMGGWFLYRKSRHKGQPA